MGRRRKLDGLRILVTGASQGIGRALALAAAGRGMKVLAAARSAPLLDELAREARAGGGELQTVQADVASPDDRRRMAEAALRRYGGLDVLVNNAGIGATGHFADVSPERLRSIMEVNFFGLTETTRVCLPLLRQGVTPAIVNVSSIAGKRGLPAQRILGQQVRGAGVQRGAAGRAGQGRRRCAGGLPRPDPDEFLAEHDRTEGAAAIRPFARNDIGNGRAGGLGVAGARAA